MIDLYNVKSLSILLIGWDIMSIKKELLNELSEQQLKQLCEYKGIDCSLSKISKEYYEQWSEKDKLVDIITDYKQISVSDIEKYICEVKED